MGKKNESLREAVCDAFGDYLSVIMTEKPRDLLKLGPLFTIASRVAHQFGLNPGVHLSPDWCRDFGFREPAELSTVFVALVSLVRSRAARGETVRLLCHCAPRRCHCEDIAAEIERQDSDIVSVRSEHPRRLYSTLKPDGIADGHKQRKRIFCPSLSPRNRT